MTQYNGKKYYSTIEDNIIIIFDERDLSTNGDFFIPEGVKCIKWGAFHNIQGLKNLYIPKSVQNIDECALHCTIGNILCNPENPRYEVKNGCLIDTKLNTIIKGGNDSVVPSNIKIEPFAFSFCEADSLTFNHVLLGYTACKKSKVKKVKIANINLNNIEDKKYQNLTHTFLECKNLESLELVNVTGKLFCTFVGCENLKEISIIGGEPIIFVAHGSTLYGCAKLKTINMDNNMTADSFLNLINTLSVKHTPVSNYDINLFFYKKEDLLKGNKNSPIVKFKKSEIFSLLNFDSDNYTYDSILPYIMHCGNETALDFIMGLTNNKKNISLDEGLCK